MPVSSRGPGGVGPGDATHAHQPPAPAPPAKRAGSSDAACRHGLMWDHTVFHVVPNWRASPEIVAPSILFYTVAHLSEQVIAGNQLYAAPDPDSFLFTIISSSMLMTWQMTIGGRLESRLRFANKVVWNTLPLPAVSDKQRADIIAAGQGVLEARAEQPGISLADMYNPLAMSPSLLKAHRALDRAVDRAFGARKALETNEQRLTILFKRYQEMTATES